MHGMFSSTAWGRLARAATLGVGALVLAGCVADYAYVQPNAAGGGGYDTGDVPYSGQGYYDDYGTGPYYLGTGGYGYYNGTGPWSNTSGWYGGYDGDYGYWPSVTFNFGISSVWDFPGYWGPWYSTVIPIRGCWHGCRHDWRRHDHHRHRGGHDPVAASSPRPWQEYGHAPASPRRGQDAVISVPTRPVETFVNRPLPSAAFVPHDYVRAPASRMGNFGIPPPATPRTSAEPDFAGRVTMPMSVRQDYPVRQEFRVAPQSGTRQTSGPSVAPVARAAPQRSDGSRTRIP